MKLPPEPVPGIYSVPGYKEVYNSLNNIKRLLVLPCSNPVGVYVEAAAEAAITMLYSALEPDVKELIHMATGKSALCHVKTLVADIHDDVGLTPTKVSRVLGQLGEAYDMATWNLFVLGIAANGLAQFTSTMLQQQGCANKFSPSYGTGGAYVGAIYDNGQWYSLDFAVTEEHSDFYPVSVSGIDAKPHRTALIAASARFQDFNGVPVGTNSRIVRLDTGAYLDYDTNGLYSDAPHASTHVWYKSRSQFAQNTAIEAQWSYDGDPLPLGEAFPIHSSMHAYFAH